MENLKVLLPFFLLRWSRSNPYFLLTIGCFIMALVLSFIPIPYNPILIPLLIPFLLIRKIYKYDYNTCENKFFKTLGTVPYLEIHTAKIIILLSITCLNGILGIYVFKHLYSWNLSYLHLLRSILFLYALGIIFAIIKNKVLKYALFIFAFFSLQILALVGGVYGSIFILIILVLIIRGVFQYEAARYL